MTRDEGGALARQRHAGGGLGLGEGGREVARDPHHLAGRAHLGAEQGVGALEAVERQHRLLDRDVLAEAHPLPAARQARGRAIRSPSMIRQASFASGRPTALDTNGTVRDARGLASITYSSPACTAYWTFSSPTTPIASAISRVARADLLEHLLAERVRRQHAGAVAGVHAGLLDVLHDPADPHLAAVAQRVHVDLGGVLEEAVEEDLPVAAPASRRR